MQPLGLTPDQHDAYVARVLGDHDETWTLEVLDTEERVLASGNLAPDGSQVSIQKDAAIRRTADLSIVDPAHELGLDSEGPWEPLPADVMLRVKVSVRMPWGPVTATPFVGSIDRLAVKDGVLQATCHDKTVWGVRGAPPMTVKRKMNAVEALRALLESTGETRFRFPAGMTERLTESYSTGWADEVAAEPVCQQIVTAVWGPEWQLITSCDGYRTLRPVPTEPVIDLPVTSEPDGDSTLSAVANVARVTGRGRASATAYLPADHPWAPARLGRNGRPRYLPTLLDDSAIKRGSDAQRRAEKLVTADSRVAIEVSWSAPPFYALDVDDPVRLLLPDGQDLVVPWSTGALPLGAGGDMTGGVARLVSKPRRRGVQR